MRINLLHNKTVLDTVSDKFIESFNKNLTPKLEAAYPEAEEILLYEDYLSDSLVSGGIFYCPLTVVTGEQLARVFVSWSVNAKDFRDSVPYSYVGDALLDFEIPETVPHGFAERLFDRPLRSVKPSISFTVEANGAPTKTFLSGKYSQSFVDIMAQSISAEIEKEFSIYDTENSSLELRLVFSPTSFMEHVVDNVTYRRILISAKACSPRDLWIKWTRLDGAGNYTVSDHVSEGTILFEIADDVPEKVREREYRYLVNTASPASYKNAMSRKNFVEWRELLKRVIKRGEVSVCEPQDKTPSDIDAPSAVVSAVTETVTESAFPFGADVALSLKDVLENVDSEGEEADEDINPDITELLRGILEIQRDDAEESDEEIVSADVTDVQEEIDTLPPFDIDGELEAESEESVELSEEEPYESEQPDEEYLETLREQEQLDMPSENEESTAPFDIIEAFEYDKARDEEFESLKRDLENLKAENGRLAELVRQKEAEEVRLRALIEKQQSLEDERRREAEILRSELEAKKRSEEREKDRIAEAAKMAIEEQKRLQEDKEVEQNLRLEDERKMLLAKQVIEEKEAAYQKEEPQHEATKPAFEPSYTPPAAVPTVRYVSKTADIMFRYPVDPNVTKRIQEIIISAVKYFEKEDVYMKIKASIPEPKMVRLNFVKIPENESALLNDIIRVLGHSKLGIVKVLLD